MGARIKIGDKVKLIYQSETCNSRYDYTNSAAGCTHGIIKSWYKKDILAVVDWYMPDGRISEEYSAYVVAHDKWDKECELLDDPYTIERIVENLDKLINKYEDN